jgi:hypothetical protein
MLGGAPRAYEVFMELIEDRLTVGCGGSEIGQRGILLLSVLCFPSAQRRLRYQQHPFRRIDRLYREPLVVALRRLCQHDFRPKVIRLSRFRREFCRPTQLLPRL